MAVRRIVANQDGANNASSIAGTRERLYKDIDLSISAKPGSGDGKLGDIYKKHDVGAVLQSVETIVRCARGEKPFQPLFGAGIDSYLFELNDGRNEPIIRDDIIESVHYYEPRAEVLDVDINWPVNEHGVVITLTIRIKNTQDIVTLTTYFNRLR